MVVGCIPEWEDKILLCRRDIEPRKGFWTLPAGYLENGETAKAGAARETHEESGAVVTDLHTYLMIDIVHIAQIYLMFRARMEAPRFHPTYESSEVALFTEAQIPWDAIAFRAIETTLQYFFDDRKKGAYPFRNRQIGRLPDIDPTDRR
jgi:ADP-ribose pyrophosphatase YjhB (NUDIX family)